MDRFSCRSETPEDEPFIRQLMLETLTDQLGASSWPDKIREPVLNAQYRVRRQGFRTSAENKPGTIVLVDGEPAGWYVTADFQDEIRLVNLMVLRKHRGKGIGSAVLRKLVMTSKTLTLSVAMNNKRAFELYTRFGFAPTGADGVHHFMERPAR